MNNGYVIEFYSPGQKQWMYYERIFSGKREADGRKSGYKKQYGGKWRVIPYEKTGTFFPRRNPPSGPADEAAARELFLFLSNDGDLYRQQGLPIIKNLVAKIDRGIYKRELAVKLYMYYAESGAKKYARDFGGTWNQMFSVPTRRLVAENFVAYFEREYKLGAFNELHAKKYQKTKGVLSNPGVLEQQHKKREKEMKKILGKYYDPIYIQEFKLPKWSARVTVMNGPGGMLLARSGKWKKEDHVRLAKEFKEKEKIAKNVWGNTFEAAAHETFGRPSRMEDYRIAGIGREEFSEAKKNKLRFSAYSATVFGTLAQAHAEAASLQNRYKYKHNPPVKYLSVEQGKKLGIDNYPSFHRSGSISGMKKQFYGKDALLVRSGEWIYNVSRRPEIYEAAK